MTSVALPRTTTERRSALLFHWDAADAARVGSLDAITGQAATFTRASPKYAIDSAGRLYKVPRGLPAWTHRWDGSAWEWDGILLEAAATNLSLHSQAFDNAVWSKTNVTVSANDLAAPDGSMTAAKLTATAGNATIIQDLGALSSAARAGGMWLLRANGSGSIQITLDGGSTWTTVTVSSTIWTRVQKTQTLANPDFGIRIVTSGDAVWAWQAQVEAGAFLTSEIPTTGATATRAADALTFAYAGAPKDLTIYVDHSDHGSFQSAWARLVQIGDDDSGNEKTAVLESPSAGDANLHYHYGATHVSSGITAGAVAIGDRQELRAVIQTNGVQLGRSINGAEEVLGTASSAFTAHPSAYAESVISLTPHLFTAHAIRSVKVAAGARTLDDMRRVI